MKIRNDKTYNVTKYTQTQTLDCGNLPGTDVNAILKGYKYDENYGMWFSERGKIGYDVTEVND